MITGNPDSAMNKMENPEASFYPPPNGPPPSYNPMAYPPQAPHTYPPSVDASAGSSSQYQHQWQGSPTSPIPSPSAHHPYPAPREVYPPVPPTNVERSLPPSFGFDKKRDPLNPPPPSFSRPAPPHPPLPPFPPLTLYSKAPALDKGFPIALPTPSNRLYPGFNPYQQQSFVHPFSQRDVNEADWRRLIEDVYIAAQLSGTQKLAANVIPLAAGSGVLGGLFLTRSIERRMKKKKNEPVADLVDTWNQHFFHPRGLHVILAHGAESISGEIDGPAPDWAQPGRHGREESDDDYSSEDEVRRRTGAGGSGAGGVLGKLESRLSSKLDKIESRRGARKEKRQERQSRRADKKAQKTENYRLVVIPI